MTPASSSRAPDAGQPLLTAMPAAPRRSLLRRLLQRPDAAVACVTLALVAVASAAGPSLLPYGRDAVQLEHRNAPPGAQHFFGTDALGRDTLVRVLHGGRVSLGVALLASAVAVSLGALLGALAGYRGGRLDAVVVHGVDVALSVPTFFILLLLGSWWGANFWTLCLVIGFTNWMPVARLVRTATRELRERAFVEAARALGLGAPRILWRHVLPNAMAPILVAAALAGAQAILLESALGYLGFGLQPPTPSWGNMLQEAQAHLYDAPWAAVFPGILIFVTVLALNALADAARDTLDPRLRR